MTCAQKTDVHTQPMNGWWCREGCICFGLAWKIVNRTPQIQQMTERLSNSLNFFRWHGYQYQTKRNKTNTEILTNISQYHFDRRRIEREIAMYPNVEETSMTVNCMRKQGDSCSPIFRHHSHCALKNNSKWFIYKHKVNDTTAHRYEHFRVRVHSKWLFLCCFCCCLWWRCCFATLFWLFHSHLAAMKIDGFQF